MPPRNTALRRDGRSPETASQQETSTTVAIRLRPLNDREKEGGQNKIWRCVPTHNSVTQTSPEGNPLPDGKGTFFTYDRIFDEDSSTQAVYDGAARDIVHSVSRGMNGTIFAYGQTSSGKTFTMQGGGSEANPGIVQIATRDLFRLIQEKTDRMFLMRVSYLEIYQEEIRDLLNPENTNMQVREDPRKGIYIDAHEETVGDFETVLKILRVGEKQRHVGCTEMNSRSSRSHTIFRLVVESQQMFDEKVHTSQEEVDPSTLVATLNLVDLAGSESVRHTGATGTRQKEGGMINQSLLTLSRVIQTLTQPGHSHVNYRDSKLTRILQPSLSGNARMAIICCATAAEGFLEETRSTLQFASRAKEIKTRAIVNEIVDDKTQIRRMAQELATLKRKHAEQQGGAAAGGELVEALQQEKAEQAEKIDRLKRLLLNIAPAVADEDGEALLLHLDVSPRFRRGKRSRETWCPGDTASIVTAPRPLRLQSPNLADLDGEEEHRPKRRSSEAAIATKLEEALAAKKETDEEMKEFVAYTEDVERVLASTKALLAQEVEATEKAAGDVAAATAAAEAAAAREQESTAALEERIAALEADKADLEQQEAVLRAENEEAVAIMAENQPREPVLADADVQTEAPDSEDEAAEGAPAAGRSVADVEVAEREVALAGLQQRVEDLEASLMEARGEQREQEVCNREDKQKADESLIEALAAQRRAEDAFSAACQSELEMRCRLENAVQQVQEAEEARDAMSTKAEGEAASVGKEREKVRVLEDRVAETETRLDAAEQAKTATEEEARREVLASKEKDETIGELSALVDSLSADGDRKTVEDKAKEEGDAARVQQQLEQLLSDKNKAEEEAAAARAENEALCAKIDELSGQVSSVAAEAEAREDLAAAKEAAAAAAEAKVTEDMARVVEEAMASAEQLELLRSELETKAEAAAEFAQTIESLESQLRAVQDSASEREAADAARIADAESQAEEAAGRLLAANEATAAEKEGTAESAELLAEVESELTAANELLATVQDAMAEKEASAAARIAELEAELASAAGSLAAAQAAAGERETAASERIAEVESELSAANELLASAPSAVRVEQLENELKEATESFGVQLAAAREEEEEAVSKQVALGVERVAEVEAQLKAAKDRLGEVLSTAEEAEALRETVGAEREETVAAAAKHDAEMGEARRELDRVKALLEAKADEVEQQKASDELRQAREAAAAAEAAVAEREATIASMKETLGAGEGELAQTLEESENLSKEVLELTEQLMAKDATLAELREQLEARESELAELRASPPATSNAANDGFDGEATEASAELRRLRVDLDKKGSELDTTMKECEAVRAELKEVKGMLGAAASAAGAAGADEQSLRKRVSQLMCENGLLRGEKDRQEVLAAEAKNEAKANTSRSAAEVERLQREVDRLSGVVAGKADGVAAEGDRAKAALSAMEAKLSELRQERAELQEATQRSLDRCSEAEGEVETLRNRLAEVEGRDASRGVVVALETKVDELEQEVRRTAASKAEVEVDAREHANRVKRLQGEVEMIRSEYEVVSEEVADLRVAEAKLKEALALQQATTADGSEDRSNELETEVARLGEELSELKNAHLEALSAEEEKRGTIQATHGESVAALERTVSELQEANYSSAAALEKKVSELQAERDEVEKTVSELRAKHGEIVATLEGEVSELQAAKDSAATLEKTASDLRAEHGEIVAALEDKVSELQAASDSSAAALGQTTAELRAEHDATVAALEKTVSELQEAKDSTAAALEEAVSEMQAEHSETVTALEEKISELQAASEASAAALGQTTAELRAEHDETVGALKQTVSELQEAESTAAVALEKTMSGLRVEHGETVTALEEKVSELQAAKDSSVIALGQTTAELRAEHDETVAALEKAVSEMQAEHGETVTALEEKVSELQAAKDSSVIALGQTTAELRAEHDETVAALEKTVSELQQAKSTAAAALEKTMSDLRAEHGETVTALEEKVSELQAASGASAVALGQTTAELRAEHDETVAALEKTVSELQAAKDSAAATFEKTMAELQTEHDQVVTALEEKLSESLELAEQVGADQDVTLAALRAQMAASHADEIAEVRAQLSEAERAVEATEAASKELSKECEVRSAEVAEELDVARGRKEDLERELTDNIAAGKATEEQLRHRLTSQVAEAENLRQELMDTRERSDRAEAAVRASDQRARESADEKTKGLLAEMENLCQEKLIAENKAGEMEAELGRLREAVATAEQTAAKDQGMLIRAAEERMAVLDQAAQEKDIAIAKLQASLDAAHASAAAESASSSAAGVEEATAALNDKVAALTAATGEQKETIARQDARIKKLEQVRLTNGQVEKLQAMKASARRTAAENTELKQRLSVLKERLEAAEGGVAGAGAGDAPSGDGEAATVTAALAAAADRNAELQAAKDTLVEKLKGYGKRVYELEKQHTRVRAAVAELGGSVSEGGDLGDAVLECAGRFAGRGGDMSVMSTGSHDEAAAAAAAVEELQRELREVREALRVEEAGRARLKEQMLAGVAKFRALEAQEKSTRERLEEAAVGQRGAVSAALKTKEKDHERELKFLKEENVQLFKEIGEWKSKADKLTAELETLQEKLAAAKTAQQASPSMSKKRALGDRTNNTPAKATATAAVAGKLGAATSTTAGGVQPAAAAERRAASRALLDGEGPINDEGAGECNQS
ncbi:kinesin family-like protein [Ectocarpus siliculosus]|uniref:Kinesin family-like protein n=1 Tax=Ectocarpus siliculosus TaxID=2880 RepID=D7FIN0_ECTSI|nr:kinesin family-like protein [Ectocarpus siliculosus]|eukprot:CBJ28848.1 kinesin family-like protein [Ectocarpus siliculosus]